MARDRRRAPERFQSRHAHKRGLSQPRAAGWHQVKVPQQSQTPVYNLCRGSTSSQTLTLIHPLARGRLQNIRNPLAANMAALHKRAICAEFEQGFSRAALPVNRIDCFACKDFSFVRVWRNQAARRAP